MAENNSENVDVDIALQHTHIWNGYLPVAAEIEALAHRMECFD